MRGDIAPRTYLDEPGAPARIDERAAPRFTLLMRQAKLRAESREYLCVIRDVSVSGISIRTFHPLPTGIRFEIELREGHPYLIEKVWEREGEAGFRFTDRVSLDEMLAEDRRYARRPLRLAAGLAAEISAGGMRGRATIVNISQQGARIEADRNWARDQLLRIDAPGLGTRHAKVRWRREYAHGLVFEETFSMRDFAGLVARFNGIA